MVIMNAKKFNKLIEQYDPLDKNIALEFLSLSKEYPYFQLPHYYHAKSLKEQGSNQYQKVLNKLALKTLDRSVLKKSMEELNVDEVKDYLIEKKLLDKI